ncbi:MAG: 2-oxoglutarate dehydrogenase E1 component [Rhodospirillaceae bacterium]|jgi:2-oxoglutarate dehydrogenase E1 component|nr:2-oxoglutarate dehydrogenase E1 component [Rhodospirillaceae bacterium]MBT4701822.1 2-oxoglutarate dehydrogenase E1 component [Rhodospirillaceae bacterium]MBT5033413.1 2-oxoglutarate dehydrogenase E1 component [Rhodospirillaceae bacterium]MBT6218482.1 2-oxoglutarate dehydrogenase E1 component [Rhodospirillaceae bacterium]MBT6360839.1 2-oxoglutarate dehydrogenase E1 component [Rhodospirillaceae bacterium]
MASSFDSILNGTNATYIAELYSRYLEDNNSVDASWAEVFEGFDDENRAVMDELQGASWAPSGNKVIGHADEDDAPVKAKPAGKASADSNRQDIIDSLSARMMIRVYRVRGHLIANFDPLGIEGRDYHSELDPKTYGFEEADMDRPIFINNVLGLETATPREILAILRETYCGSTGVEFMHISEPEERTWIQDRIEGIRNHTHFTPEGKKAIYQRLIEAEGFEAFLQVKHTGTKRFGLDGGESMIPALEQILKRGAQLGIQDIVIGMPHRGRLNVLTSIMRKPYINMFAEFQGMASNPDDVQGSGDVKYHLGTSDDREFDGHNVHLSLQPNPSHLEAVNPVVIGKVRSKQNLINDEERSRVMGVLMHGDAAFAGQGLVPETLDMSQLRGYRVGGTIHLIVNNQIGFTTMPAHSRSSPYPSDIAKGIAAPIFHVNGDDPEAVVHVARIATEFRQEFKRDVVIDMFCYRRHGHNEGDEPMFTQPMMYKTIAKHPTTLTLYGQQLVKDGTLTEEEAQGMIDDFNAKLEADFQAAQTYKPNKADWLEGHWQGLVQLSEEEEHHEHDTSAPMELLKEVGESISRVPDSITAHSKIVRQLKAKQKMLESGTKIDWALAEALAFGSLLVEGTRVRLSGQDAGRGTFSHRHCVLHDQESDKKYFPLSEISPGKQAKFEVMDSPLSEAAVLGFEYGYSLNDPHSLVLWEAQFGDFANTAQGLIDQFVASGESKWLRMCGLVLLLPHGMEGQGPEHSSARLERFLQLSAEDNWQVVNITTPANYFHALRRQIKRNYRKPMVVMSPKSLLRHKLVTSPLGAMGPDTRFRRVIPEVDRLGLDKNVRRVVLCSGKVYYDLLEARREAKIKDVAIVRIEQLYPWPRTTVFQQLQRYPNAEVIWCQEEAANNGAWTFIFPRLDSILEAAEIKAERPIYVGRKAAASPATGIPGGHAKEQKLLVEQALTHKVEDLPQPFRRGGY